MPPPRMITFTCGCLDLDWGLHHNNAAARLSEVSDIIRGRRNNELRGDPVAAYRMRVTEAS